VQKNDDRAAGRTRLGAADIQEAGIDLLQGSK
jgi:hypothetical protein